MVDFCEYFMPMGQGFFYLSLPSHWSRALLRVLLLQRGLVSEGFDFVRCDSRCVFRVCAPLGADVFLGGDSYYKFIFGHPICGRGFSKVNVGGVCRR